MNSTEDWKLNKKLADDWWELMTPTILKQQEDKKIADGCNRRLVSKF